MSLRSRATWKVQLVNSERSTGQEKLPPINGFVCQGRKLKLAETLPAREAPIRRPIPPKERPPLRLARKGGDFIRVTPFLYIGDSDAPKNRYQILRHRIGLILTVAEEAVPEEYGWIRYMRVPLRKDRPGELGHCFLPVAEVIQAVAREGGVTLLHSSGGVARAAALALGYFLLTTRCSLMSASQHVGLKGISLDDGLWRQLGKLEEELSPKKDLLARLQQAIYQARQPRPPPRKPRPQR